MPDLANKLIAENERTKDKFLDLGKCGLTEVPAEVGELVWLESLSLADGTSQNTGERNCLTDLTPLASLSGLQSLKVNGTQIKDLTPLAHLSALKELEAQRTPVSDLTPLARLSGLRKLIIFETEVKDLAPLAGLSALQMLHVWSTRVSDLTPLAGLSALRDLNVGSTQVSDLTPLAGLFTLESLSYTNCPLKNPPPEIVARGTKAVLNYLRELALGKVDYLYEAKMLILGEGGAGKTSLLRRLYEPDGPLPTEKETTKGIAIHRHEFKLKNGQTFRLNVWDFGGQEIYHATHQFFLTHRSLYVLVDDTRKDYKTVSDEGFKYWLELIAVFGGHSPTLIFQNEKDGRSKEIDINGIRQHYDNVGEVYRGDLYEPHSADTVRNAIEFQAEHLTLVGEALPAHWIGVRADIEVRARETPYISQDEYFGIYGRHIEPDRRRALWLSQYLHDLGVFLHFQDSPVLAPTVILQNEWATKAIFRILDDETVKARHGSFTGDDCQRLWPDAVYADMHLQLVELMKRFELCYELPDSKPQTWLAPQLLPAAKPAAALADWGKAEEMVLRYRYDFLPKGMVSRLTVRLHRYVRNPKMAWVSGVLFEHGGTQVLVELLPTGSEIELRARGPENKALLSVIAAALEDLNESIQGLRDKVHKLVPCNCEACRIESVPTFFEYTELVRAKEHKVLTVQCTRRFLNVNVLELLEKAAPSATTSPRTIRIFLASSSELRKDRDDFELYFRQLNDSLLKEGVYLTVVRWEHFLDAMSETRLQDEYNNAIRECDIFVSLFFTRAGEFTGEEFDVALRQFTERGRPLIYTFFKKALVDIDSLPPEDFNSLQAFKSKLQDHGHFYTRYENVADLKLQFRGQLDKILDHDA